MTMLLTSVSTRSGGQSCGSAGPPGGIEAPPGEGDTDIFNGLESLGIRGANGYRNLNGDMPSFRRRLGYHVLAGNWMEEVFPR